MNSLKEDIIRLRESGQSYNQIAKALECSKSSVAYHLSPTGKDENNLRQRVRRKASHTFVKKTEAFRHNRFGKKNEDLDSGRTYIFSWKDVLEKIGSEPECYATGRKINVSDSSSFNFDHIIPVTNGGDNSLENLGILCTQANLAKRHYSLQEFMDMCEEIYLHKHG